MNMFLLGGVAWRQPTDYLPNFWFKKMNLSFFNVLSNYSKRIGFYCRTGAHELWLFIFLLLYGSSPPSSNTDLFITNIKYTYNYIRSTIIPSYSVATTHDFID